MRVGRIVLVVVIPLALTGWLLFVKWEAQYRMAKIDFIVRDYQHERHAGLDLAGLTAYVEQCGGVVSGTGGRTVITYRRWWMGRTWELDATPRPGG